MNVGAVGLAVVMARFKTMPELGFCKLLLAIIGAVLTGLTLFKLVICCLTIPKDGIADFILTLGTELV